MVIGIKDSAKMFGISLVACCAVLVCTMFLNFYMDIVRIRDQIVLPEALFFYEAQVSTAQVVCLVTGGSLLLTSVIMLLFYVKHYIDTHKKELGILKAIGYSDWKIAGNFWSFSLSILIGTLLGFGGAFLLMPWFYALQNEDKILPTINIGFHAEILVFFVLLPTVGFALLAVLYAKLQLNKPVLTLLKENTPSSFKRKSRKVEPDDRPFLQSLTKSTLRDKKVLVFFIVFASFCFAAMTQMSFSMKDLSSVMMGVMMLVIGLVLAFVTLFLAITTVVNGNKKTLAMMKVFGYTKKECASAILGGYRPFSYVGFLIGTVYQYVLLKLMVEIVFKDIQGVPEYDFDFPMMLVSLAVFIPVYEFVMYFYARQVERLSVKEIMSE